MKYSLKNKETRKRNTIFGERKREGYQFKEEEKQEGLDEIREMGEDLEDSKFNQMKGEHRERKQASFYQHINFNGVADRQKISSIGTKNIEGKHGKHALSPNQKPVFLKATQVIVDRIDRNPAKDKKQRMRLYSHVNEFSYFDSKTQTQLKMLLLKLYELLVHNNQHITAIEKVVETLIQRGYLVMHEINSGLLQFCKLQKKVDLFFNTMRNVYQGLRISKLKQQNLQLYLKQFVSCTHRHSQIQESSMSRVQSNIKMHQSQQSRELMTLLDYQSECSSNELLQQNNINNNPFIKIKTPINQELENRNQQLERELIPRQTFRVEAGRYEKLSPFQANQYISQSKFVKDLETHLMHGSPTKSMQDYSFDNTSAEYEKLRKSLYKQNNQGMHCWLDEMGCLRRGNGTYIFNSRGEVLSMSKTVFCRLCEEGYLTRLSIIGLA